MKKEERFSFVRRPGASVFFTWVALSAAIFFGAYSVRIKSMYDKELTANTDSMSKARELSYRLELASVKIKDSATTIEWSNVEINRLRQRNDEIQDKVANMRKLLYASVKKNREQEIAGIKGESVAAVTPRISKLAQATNNTAGATGKPFGQEVVLPELTEKLLNDEQAMEEIVKRSSDLKSKAEQVVAEVLTYNPNSKKVFLNLGRSNAGVVEGNRFAIWRNGKHVTDVRVAQVHNVTSTCDIISPALVGIRAGDVAELVEVSAF